MSDAKIISSNNQQCPSCGTYDEILEKRCSFCERSLCKYCVETYINDKITICYFDFDKIDHIQKNNNNTVNLSTPELIKSAIENLPWIDKKPDPNLYIFVITPDKTIFYEDPSVINKRDRFIPIYGTKVNNKFSKLYNNVSRGDIISHPWSFETKKRILIKMPDEQDKKSLRVIGVIDTPDKMIKINNSLKNIFDNILLTYYMRYHKIYVTFGAYLITVNFGEIINKLTKPLILKESIITPLLLRYDIDDRTPFTKINPLPWIYHDRDEPWPRYEMSGRPITQMIGMCKRSEHERKGLSIGQLYLPVVRYPDIYHPEGEKKEYCGTFYFIEPFSEILLNLGRTAVFGSKFHAYVTLKVANDLIIRNDALKRINEPPIKINDEINFSKLYGIAVDTILSEESWKELRTMVDKKLGNSDRYKNTIEIVESYLIPFYFTIVKSEDEVKEIKSIAPGLNTTPFYPTDNKVLENIGFAAGMHDFMDQDICNMAAEFKIDTVILQHEIGETRSVSEILDVRNNSYNYLTKVNNNNKSWYTPNVKYSTIWFTDNGFVTSNSSCQTADIDYDDINIVKINDQSINTVTTTTIATPKHVI